MKTTDGCVDAATAHDILNSVLRPLVSTNVTYDSYMAPGAVLSAEMTTALLNRKYVVSKPPYVIIGM